MNKRKILEQAFKEIFDDDWANELRDFEHGFSGFYDATMRAMELVSERQPPTEVSENNDSKALHIADVRRSCFNDVYRTFIESKNNLAFFETWLIENS